MVPDIWQDERVSLHARIIRNVRRRRDDAHGGHGDGRWGRRFALFVRFDRRCLSSADVLVGGAVDLIKNPNLPE
jgi:hypothetical protein